MTSKQKTLLLFLLISAVVFIAFLPSLFCDFVNFDDTWMLTTNHLVRTISLEHVFYNIFGVIYYGVYQPLVFLSFAVEYYFFTLNPFVYHFDNIILHIFNTLLVFIFIDLLSGNKNAAFVGCLFWSLSPLRVESVTWVAERKDLLYAFFYLLSLIKYIHYLKNGKKKSDISLSLVFFFLSCLSKLTAVSLSFIIVLLDYYYYRRPNFKTVAEKAIYFSISLATGFFSIWALKKTDEVSTSFEYSIVERAHLVSNSLINYFAKTIIPYNLSVFHPYQYPPGTLPGFYFIFLLLSTIGMAAFIWYSLKFKNRKVIFGILFFASAILFALQIFPVGDAAFADRNIYISGIGIAFLIGEFYLHAKKKIPSTILFSATCLILLIYGFFTYRQTKIWQNSITLFTNVIEKYPDSYLGYGSRGIAKFNSKDYQSALEDFNKSLEKNSKYHKSLLNRALVREKLNDFEGALSDYNEILLVYPNYRNAFINRGSLYHKTGKFYEAIKDFSCAINIKPKNPYMISLALINRGRSRLAIKDLDSAIADLNYSISIIPDNPEAWYQRGLCYYSKNEFIKAKSDLLIALRFDPQNAKAYYSLGICEISLNNKPLACEYLHQSALLSYMEGNKMYLFHCSDSEVKQKMFYSNGNFKFKFNMEFTGQKDTIYYLCHFDSMENIIKKGVIDLSTQKYNGEIIWYYPGNSIQKTGFLRDTIPFGKWKEFYINGNIRTEYSFSNGLLSGTYKAYYPDEKIQTERFYNNGKLMNVFFCRDSRGNPIKYGNFAEGNGTLKIFDENGKVIQEIFYKDGINSN